MLEKLQTQQGKLDKKLKSVNSWRMVSNVIFGVAFAALLICSVVAAALAAPPVAAAATAIPLGSMGKWFGALWKKYETELKGQKEVICSMEVCSYIAVMDLDNIQVLVDRLERELNNLLQSADISLKEEEAVRTGMEEIRMKMGVFKKSIEDLSEMAYTCGRDVRQARTVVLQKLINHPSH